MSVTANDGSTPTTSSFTLTIQANEAPSFANAIANQNFVHDAEDYEFFLPGIIDPDSSSPTTTVGTGLPSYIDFNSPNEIRIKPSDAGVT